MGDWLRETLRDRPWWMNAMMVFCAFMTFVYMPWDIFWKPVAEDQEVWFGIMFTGWAAKVTAFPHWFVYGAGLYGFRHRRPWMPVWGGLYIGSISFGMFLWSVIAIGGFLGFFAGLVSATPFAILAMLMWGATDHFSGERPRMGARYGEWALVTGASSGIGAEFARSIAEEGMNCVLVARREARLAELAKELEQNHGVEVRVVAANLATAKGCKKVLSEVKDLEIGALVNNAGVGCAGRFDKANGEKLREVVALNCMAPVVLTHGLLPDMRERGAGAVIFTGSVAGRQPIPLHAVYAASKAFDQFLGEALFVECKDAGVDVIVLEPGSTQTEFQAEAGEIPHPGEHPHKVARDALDRLGQTPSVITRWSDSLRANLATRLGSRAMVAYVARDVMALRVPYESR